MGTSLLRTTCVLALLAGLGTPVSVFAQDPAGGGQPQITRPPQVITPAPTPAPPKPPEQPTQVRRLTVDEAVRLATENNLGLSIARIDPILEDINIGGIRAAWIPSFNTTVQTNRQVSQNTGFLSGAAGDKATNSRYNTEIGIGQNLQWGTNYSLGWTSARSTTTNVLSSFSPQINSGLAFSVSQPLLRNFSIDGTRQQLMTSVKQREIADVELRQTIASTSRTVRNAFWDLAYAIASLKVQQESLDLARENLRNTRAKIEIGTEPPINEIEPEAEVARQEESVITAEGRISTAEDTLRSLIFDPNDADFWTIKIEPAELPRFEQRTIDVDAAVRNALDKRSDLTRSRKALEQSDISIRYLRNQTLPELNANFDYSVSGVGGTQLTRTSVIGGEVVGRSERSFGAVIGDLFTNDYPTWSASVTMRYPLGHSPQESNLAQARLQYSQTLTQIRQQQMQVALQVREAARQVETNQKRVETTRRSREFAERKLDAEQRKLAAGTNENYFVLQAQRDLAQARNAELQAILDYYRSVVDFDTVQEIPLGGGAGLGGGGAQAVGGGGGAAGAAGGAGGAGGAGALR